MPQAHPTWQHAPLLTIARNTIDRPPQHWRHRKNNWFLIALAVLAIVAGVLCTTVALGTDAETTEDLWVLGALGSLAVAITSVYFGLAPSLAHAVARWARTFRAKTMFVAVLFAALLTLFATVLALGAALDPDDPDFVDALEVSAMAFGAALILTFVAETLIAPPLTVRPNQITGHRVLTWTTWYFGAFAVSATAVAVSVIVFAREDQTAAVILPLIMSLLVPVSWLPLRWAFRRPGRYRDARPEIASRLMRLSSAAQEAEAAQEARSIQDAQVGNSPEINHLADEVSNLRATLRKFRDDSPLANRAGAQPKLLDLLDVGEFCLRDRTPRSKLTKQYPHELSPVLAASPAELANAVDALANDLLAQVH